MCAPPTAKREAQENSKTTTLEGIGREHKALKPHIVLRGKESTGKTFGPEERMEEHKMQLGFLFDFINEVHPLPAVSLFGHHHCKYKYHMYPPLPPQFVLKPCSRGAATLWPAAGSLAAPACLPAAPTGSFAYSPHGAPRLPTAGTAPPAPHAVNNGLAFVGVGANQLRNPQHQNESCAK